MRLTLYTDYSLRVLLYLAYRNDRLVTISELADFYKISRNHLVKVVHKLGIDGYITTIRGKNGGLRLARPANEIVIGDVVRHTEPDFEFLECFNAERDQCVITDFCALKGVLFQAQANFLSMLDGYTLSDTVKSPSSRTEFKQIPIVQG